jgi:4-aminobutyrate--pyruvate transaminase
MTPHFQEGLRALTDHPLVGEVRGKGLVAGVELVKDKPSHTPFDSDLNVGSFCNQRAEEHGLIVRAIGDTISFCPPLIISEKEIKEIIERFKLALDDTWEWLCSIKE